MRMYQQGSEAQWDFGFFGSIFPNYYYERACQQVPTIDGNYSFREEETGTAQMEQQQYHPDIHAQNWSYPCTGGYNSGNEVYCEKLDDMEPSSSRSSPCEGYYDGEDWSVGLKENFSQMVPIPHVPRVNGEIPSVDEATTDHQRLIDRLQVYDLVEHKVQGDGNCQFRALADQLYQSSEHHKFVREQVINQLKSQPEAYEGYVPMAYHDYLEKLLRDGEWGDHVTLQAAADSYGVKIFVMTSFKDTCYIEILPKVQKSQRVIFLSFWAEVHYNSIYPKGDFPDSYSRKKKWWQF